MQLTPHFSLEELTRSSTAERRGIDNTPSPSIMANLMIVAEGLEKVRAALPIHNTAIIVDSGYRSMALNAAIGGAKNSAHTRGLAADIWTHAMTNEELIRRILGSGINFDQLILEGSWVHISFDPRMRQEVLTAHFAGGGVTYTEGLGS